MFVLSVLVLIVSITSVMKHSVLFCVSMSSSDVRSRSDALYKLLLVHSVCSLLSFVAILLNTCTAHLIFFYVECGLYIIAWEGLFSIFFSI